jgi:hypothetical protein
MTEKVVHKNKKTGLYFCGNLGFSETQDLNFAIISLSKTKWNYIFYEIYEECSYSNEQRILRKNKLKKNK